MKKLLHILLSLQSVMFSCLSIVGCKQNVRALNSSMLTSSTFTLYFNKIALENLENSKINLSVLQNKSELFKELEAVIKSKVHQVNIQNNSLKIYDKNNNLEIIDVNQDLIKMGFEVKVELVLEHNGSTLSVEFNCKIVDKNMFYLNAIKETIENLSQPFEIKIGKTFNTDLLLNFILKYFKNNNYITNSNVIISNKLEFYDLTLQNSITINNIKFDIPFVLKTNVGLNSAILSIIFKVKLIHSTDLDVLDSSIKKIQSHNEFKVYTANRLMDLTVFGNKLEFLYNMFATNELKENIAQMDIIHNLGFDIDHYLYTTKIINKTNGDELKGVTWKQRVALKGIFKISDGELPFEFYVVLANPNENKEIQSICKVIFNDIIK